MTYAARPTILSSKGCHHSTSTSHQLYSEHVNIMSKSAAKHVEDDDASEENVKEVEEEAVVVLHRVYNTILFYQHMSSIWCLNTTIIFY